MPSETDDPVLLHVLNKTEKLPTAEPNNPYSVVTLSEFTLTGVDIKGKQLDRWFFNAKVNGKRFTKVYIDVALMALLGKVDELTPWTTIVKISEKKETNI